MRRRFGRGRPLRRALRRAIPPLLIQANRLIDSGNFAEGAEGLEQIARAAEARGNPQAAALFIEAGRARLFAVQGQTGLDLLKRGLSLMAASGLGLRLARASRRIVSELRGRELSHEAEEIAAFVAGMQGGDLAKDAPSSAPRPSHLPAHCPDCGAPVRPDESEWLDEATAECQYCGSPIRAA